MVRHGDAEPRSDLPSSLPARSRTVVIAFSSLLVGMLVVLLIANRPKYHRWQIDRLHSRLSGTAGASRMHQFEDLLFGDVDFGRIKTHLEALVDLGELNRHTLRVAGVKGGSPHEGLLIRELVDGHHDGRLVDFMYARGDLTLWCMPEHSAEWHDFIEEFNAAAENSTEGGGSPHALMLRHPSID